MGNTPLIWLLGGPHQKRRAAQNGYQPLEPSPSTTTTALVATAASSPEVNMERIHHMLTELERRKRERMAVYHVKLEEARTLKRTAPTLKMARAQQLRLVKQIEQSVTQLQMHINNLENYLRVSDENLDKQYALTAYQSAMVLFKQTAVDMNAMQDVQEELHEDVMRTESEFAALTSAQDVFARNQMDVRAAAFGNDAAALTADDDALLAEIDALDVSDEGERSITPVVAAPPPPRPTKNKNSTPRVRRREETPPAPVVRKEKEKKRTRAAPLLSE